MSILKNLDVPFSNSVLEQKAAELIRQYGRQRAWVPSLPIPVDAIIEHSLDLRIEYDVIKEPPGTTIWGCITPAAKTITLNESHVDAFSASPGLERFTLGHEICHWVLHVDKSAVSQAPLFGPPPEAIVCRDGDDRACETAANRFSAFLLMPRDLMRAEVARSDVASRPGFVAFAARIGVSSSALRIRLGALGIACGA